jgi:DNA-binding transcriptional MerR regulator
MYTTKKAAELAGIGRSTVPHYAREWSKYLGDAAKVEGKTRYFTDDDIDVFRTVKVLRDQNTPSDEIRAFLADGNRAEPVEVPPDPPETPPDATKHDNARSLRLRPKSPVTGVK